MGLLECVFTDTGSFFHLVSKDELVIPNDPRGICYAGVQLRNSEVGAYALSGYPSLYRVVCSNGLVICAPYYILLHQIHAHVKPEVMKEKVREMLGKAPGMLEDMVARVSHASTIDVDPKEEIDRFVGRVSKNLATHVMEAYSEEPIPTVYGISQAIARCANSVPDRDRKYELQQLAGKYLLTIKD